VDSAEKRDRAPASPPNRGQRGAFWAVLVFSALYLPGAGILAWHKPLWHDETVTHSLARLHGPSAIWSALRTGSDLNPPLYHVAAHVSQALFGDSAAALRLPSILGFWLMCVCLFRSVGRWCSPVYAWSALLWPLVTGAYEYAYEARPYGLLLGWSGLAFLCWQSATGRGRRSLALPGLALALGAAVCTHFYAVLVFLPLVLGELARSLSHRRLDAPVWISLGAGLMPLAFLLPLIEQARARAPHFWAKPTLSAVPSFYDFLLTAAIPPAVVFLGLLALGRERVPSEGDAGDRQPVDAPPRHEVVAAVAFAALPAFAVVLAVLTRGAYAARYALPAVIGFGVLLPLVSSRIARGRPALGFALVAVLVGGFLFREAQSVKRECDAGSNLFALVQSLDRAGPNTSAGDLPVVIADPLDYSKVNAYAPESLSRRLLFVAVSGEDGTAQGSASADLEHAQPWAPVKTAPYEEFVASHEQFLVYGKADSRLPTALVEGGARVEVRRGGLFLVSLGEPGAPPAGAAEGPAGARQGLPGAAGQVRVCPAASGRGPARRPGIGSARVATDRGGRS
jgi:hypothetical protein